jgi:hypothetical protein
MTQAAPHQAPAAPPKPRPQPKPPAPKPQAQAKAPPPPTQPQKQVAKPTQDCPLKAEKPCDVDKIKLKVEVGETPAKKLEAKKVRRGDPHPDVTDKDITALLLRYDLIIDVAADYPTRENAYPKVKAKIELEAEYHGSKCATQTHPRIWMTPGGEAAELPPGGIVVKDTKIGPKEFVAPPFKSDFGFASAGIMALIEAIKAILPFREPKMVEVRADSCGIRARGDGGSRRVNLIALVRIYRNDTWSIGVKLPPLGSYKHERSGTVTGEREQERKTETSSLFGRNKSSTSSKTSADGYEYTTEQKHGGQATKESFSRKEEGGHVTQEHSWQSRTSQGFKAKGEDGHFETEVMKELEKQGPVALVISRNGRDFEKEIFGEKKTFKQKILDGLVKGCEAIAKGIETFNKIPQFGWKFEFSLSFFAGTIALEVSPLTKPKPLADNRYLALGWKVVGKIAMKIIALEASLSFGVDAKAFGTGAVIKIEGKIGLECSVETEIKIDEGKPKVEVALKPEASVSIKAMAQASFLGKSLTDAAISCKVAITLDEGKLEFETKHGIVLKGTLKREKIEIKGHIKVPIWGLHVIDPPIKIADEKIIHKFG